MGPLTQTLNGNSYVGLAVCALTKYVEAAGKIALKNQNFFERVYTLVIQTYCNRGGSVQNPDPSGACGGLLKKMNFTFHIIVKCINYIQSWSS